MTQYTFDVTMTCSGCTGAVTRVLKKPQGVDKFDVSLEKQRVTVKSSTLSETDILAVIQRTGKPAKVATAV